MTNAIESTNHIGNAPLLWGARNGPSSSKSDRWWVYSI